MVVDELVRRQASRGRYALALGHIGRGQKLDRLVDTVREPTAVVRIDRDRRSAPLGLAKQWFR